jgi:peptidoglycan/LPS O-acetylase OafA/YrhL
MEIMSRKSYPKRLVFLDSLRGIAALMVVFHHFMVFNGPKIQLSVSHRVFDLFTFLSDLNVEAVLFFFVLSGFSIGLAQKGAFLTHQLGTNRYLYKRFKRILPIYWLALAFTIFIGILINSYKEPSYSLVNFIGNLLFLQTSTHATNYWFSPYGENGPLWSLAYELFFYLFFPFLSWFIFKYKDFEKKWLTWAFLVFLTLIAIIINKYGFYIPPLAFLSYFLVWWAGFQIARDQFIPQKSNFFWLFVFIISAVIQILSPRIPSTSIIEISEGLLIASLFYFLLVWNRIWQSPSKNEFKTGINFFFKQVGYGSYALYALHYPLFIYLNHQKMGWMYQIIYIFGLLFCCIVIEKWTVKQKFRLFKLNFMRIKSSKIG